jgi:hypothetical protein
VFELLRDRYERDALRIEDLDDLGEVGQRAGQPVDLVADDDVDSARLDIGEKLLQGRAVHGRARQPAVVISLCQRDPAFVALALDVGFASLALGMQRVELLFEPLLGGFAGVNGAAPPHLRPPRLGAGLLISGSRFAAGRRSAAQTSARR